MQILWGIGNDININEISTLVYRVLTHSISSCWSLLRIKSQICKAAYILNLFVDMDLNITFVRISTRIPSNAPHAAACCTVGPQHCRYTVYITNTCFGIGLSCGKSVYSITYSASADFCSMSSTSCTHKFSQNGRGQHA